MVARSDAHPTPWSRHSPSLGLGKAGSRTAARYYDSAQGKSGRGLRDALHNIIKGHTVVLYDSTSNVDTVDALEVLDQDPADTNNVILVYSGWSVTKTNYGVNGWNREHLWPNSYGFDIDVTTTWPALRDLFNLRPCDSHVNSSRGNKYYDFSDPTDPNYKSSAHPSAPLCSTDTDSWEPPDSVKGDIARVMFYMDLRYAGEFANEPDLVLTDDVASIMSGNPFMGRLSTLLLWHRSDPVDAGEQSRNDLIYQRYQHNRNPFVDHPEWVDLMFAPRLLVSRETNQLRLSWDAVWAAANLEVTQQFPATWSAVTLTPSNANGQFVVFLNPTNAGRFYRLGVH